MIAVFSFSASFNLDGQSLNIKDRFNLSFTKCWFQIQPDWPKIECGILLVPQSYKDSSSLAVELPFVRISPPIVDDNLAPLVIAGGGGPGLPVGISPEGPFRFGEESWYNVLYSTLGSSRELILTDNRGVGTSRPNLNCPEVERGSVAALQVNANLTEGIKIYRESLEKCKNRLKSAGVDLTEYNLINAAVDLEALRLGLELESFNVLGVSYGSRIALVYENLFPNSVRSLVLDGVYPPWIYSYEQNPANTVEAVQRIFSKCKSDVQCSGRFGSELESELNETIQRLNTYPLEFSVTNPESLEPIDVTMSGALYSMTLRTALLTSWDLSRLPLVIKSTANGNSDLVAEMFRTNIVKAITVESGDEGAYASYTCFDEIPYLDNEKVQEAISQYDEIPYFDPSLVSYERAMCDVWGAAEPVDGLKDHKEITSPVLILTGELDPVTPAKWAGSVESSAGIAWSKIWSNLGHNVLAVSFCADEVVQQFLSNPEINPFLIDCTSTPETFDFHLH